MSCPQPITNPLQFLSANATSIEVLAAIAIVVLLVILVVKK